MNTAAHIVQKKKRINAKYLMVNIKRFFDRVSALDSKPGRDFIMPSLEAKMLRDEIAKLLLVAAELNSNKKSMSEPAVNITGGRW